MVKSVALSALRQDIYRLVDEVLETGEALEITRKGRTLRIVPETAPDRLARIRAFPDLINGDPEDLVAADWSREWDAGANS